MADFGVVSKVTDLLGLCGLYFNLLIIMEWKEIWNNDSDIE
jgi:hypothetical protein